MPTLKKGSAAAKAFVAKLRAAKGKSKPKAKKVVAKKTATKKVGYKSDRTQILTKATPYIKKYIDKGYSRTDAVKNANLDASNLSGWRKGTTNIIEVGEKKYAKQKNVRVTRMDNGTFQNFSTLSGYKQTPEIILGKVGAFTLLKSLFLAFDFF